ncbi:MAG TPA: hypothetical protein ENN21_06460 [Spirochaetes bacterium]|nr:hypothetical protein [Spirochaetota bacterium]
MLAWTLMTGRFVPMILSVAVPFPLIGLAVLLYGINLGIKKTVVEIDHDEVRFRLSSLFRNEDWSEPRTAFHGVLLRRQIESERQYNIIELHHERKERRVELAVYLMNLVPEAYAREKWEEYSRRLELAALRESSDGVTSRAPEDTTTALRELLKADALPAPGPPPRGIRVDSPGGFDEIQITAKRTLRPGMVFVLALSAALTWLGFFSRDHPSVNFIVVGTAAAALGTWVVLYTLMDLFTVQSLRFRSDRVVLSRKTPFGYTAGKSIYMGQIKDVRVDRGTAHRTDALYIETADTAIQMGHDLPLETLRWMRDYTMGKIRSS